MRALLAAFVVLPLLLTGSARFGTQPDLESLPAGLADASLHAIHFVDAHEGWAVGDEGLILHTIDGGSTWERQPSGTRASLRDVVFRDPFTGFAVGREELPYRGGSAGVILFTDDGGVRWRTASSREIPGIFGIRFADADHGFLLAEATEALPSGLFTTADGGATWKMVPGPYRTGWLCGAFLPGPAGVVAGPAGMFLHQRGDLLPCATPDSAGRTIQACHLDARGGFAVGDRGLAWKSANRGATWDAVDLQLPPELRDLVDFSTVRVQGDSIWLAGRPGSIIVHSPDAGRTWQRQSTGQNLPIRDLFFLDAQRGWAVGAAGLVLSTVDGGANWKLQRRGAARAAALIFASAPEHVPLATIASLGGDEGYLVQTVYFGAPSTRGCQTQPRLHEAVRRAGGLGGTELSGFPVPEYMLEGSEDALAAAWGQGDGSRGRLRLENQVLLAIRTWRPDVVLVAGGDDPAGRLLGQAVRAACARAGDAGVRAEFESALNVAAHRPLKLYTDVGERSAQVALDLDNVRPLLSGSANDQAASARPLIHAPGQFPASTANYELGWSHATDAKEHTALMQGSTLERGGQARRPAAEIDPTGFEAAAKHSQDRRELVRKIRLMASNPLLAKPGIAAIEQGLPALSDLAAGEVAFLLAQQFINSGNWPQAREVFFLLLDRYPDHPLAAEANRWLVEFSSSSLTQRREVLKHFPAAVPYQFQAMPTGEKRRLPTSGAELGGAIPVRPPQTLLQRQRGQLRDGHASCLVLGELLTVHGPQAFADPRMQFCIQASHRHLNEAGKAQLWYTQFLVNQQSGPWFDAAAAELWLNRTVGPCPKPLLSALRTHEPPILDGRFDEPCWQGCEPVPLRVAAGKETEEYATQMRIAYDDQFVYLAIDCARPAGAVLAPKPPRSRDQDLTGFDRLTLLLDVDRAYAVPARFEVDERGCAREDAWGDEGWNPKWFVTSEPTPAGYRIEAAIPFAELTNLAPQPGDAWAVNLVRTIPGVGVQAFSLPAGVRPRTEGMGLLRFESAGAQR